MNYPCFIAGPGSSAPRIDSTCWSDSLGHFYQGIKQALGIIRALRRGTYDFLKKLPETAWNYTAELPIYGRLSLEDWLEIRESYFPEHIQQMERTYSEWSKAASSAKTLTLMRVARSWKRLLTDMDLAQAQYSPDSIDRDKALK